MSQSQQEQSLDELIETWIKLSEKGGYIGIGYTFPQRFITSLWLQTIDDGRWGLEEKAYKCFWNYCQKRGSVTACDDIQKITERLKALGKDLKIRHLEEGGVIQAEMAEWSACIDRQKEVSHIE